MVAQAVKESVRIGRDPRRRQRHQRTHRRGSRSPAAAPGTGSRSMSVCIVESFSTQIAAVPSTFTVVEAASTFSVLVHLDHDWRLHVNVLGQGCKSSRLHRKVIRIKWNILKLVVPRPIRLGRARITAHRIKDRHRRSRHHRSGRVGHRTGNRPRIALRLQLLKREEQRKSRIKERRHVAKMRACNSLLKVPV